MLQHLQIGIDKSFRLRRNVHYFEYDGIRFKFIQNSLANPPKWSDTLVTIVEDYEGPNGRRAITQAGRWASALAWETRYPIAVHALGAGSWRPGLPLKRTRANVFVWPRLAYQGNLRGVRIDRIALANTSDQWQALTIFREAAASNSVLLSILLYWQVLEVASSQPVGWINKVFRQARLRVKAHDIAALGLGSKRLGEYLLDDCRHAIAHLRRKPGLTRITFDDLRETRRLGASLGILADLSRLYIQSELGVKESLYLVRPRGGGFPRYVDKATWHAGGYRGVVAS